MYDGVCTMVYVRWCVYDGVCIEREEIEFCTKSSKLFCFFSWSFCFYITLLGLDIDNCYFVNDGGDIRKDGSVDMSQRKVVQYVPYADSEDYRGGHGTHGKSLLLCKAFYMNHTLTRPCS